MTTQTMLPALREFAEGVARSGIGCAVKAGIACPLCRSAITEYTVNSNNVPQYSDRTRELVGFDAGNPDMVAMCARGCSIRVEASQPLPDPTETGE